MIDINTYRSRIGLFSPKIKARKYLFRRQYYDTFTWNENRSGKNTLLILQSIFKLILIITLLQPCTSVPERKLLNISQGRGHVIRGQTPVSAVCVHSGAVVGHAVMENWWAGGRSVVGWDGSGGIQDHFRTEIIDHNFEARYLYGNIQKQKGILNMHLNIRSLRFKVYEIKQLVKEHNPNIFGISECELNKDMVEEKSLKIPGYDILFPKSWSQHGYARVVVYVKKTFKYQQISELEDEYMQSVWLKGGQRNSKDIYFCHAYREHLTREGSAAQRDYLDTFLGQWEAATLHGGRAEPNETHICGDINIDTYQGKWLQPDYPHLSLSRLIKNTCDANNFHQLMKEVTRIQFNSVNNTTEVSCIDHIYTNAKFRCSDPAVISFGDSDHDLIKYTRYSKNPPIPARIVCKRSYKNFEKDAFLQDVARTDWSDVYGCEDVDQATECFTRKFRYILNVHAPWVRVQQRKAFSPWLTEETKTLMLQRDLWKQTAKDLAILSPVACQAQINAWNQYKKYRNQINNRKKHEEKNYKSGKMAEVADSPDIVWKSAKMFMGWKSQGTPNQIKVDNVLITSAKKIAKYMNEFFIHKVETIRSGMPRAIFSTTEVRNIMQNKTCKMKLCHVSVEKVKKILKSLSSSRSTGIDELDNFSVKLASDLIAEPVHHIVSLSIIQNKFPHGWKFSKVPPLHKKDDELVRKNYRPVSILSPVSKVLEKIVYEQIYNYFTRNHLFHPNLHGYRGNRSTQTALLQMYDRWVRAAHVGQLSGVVLLDLSAAFDLVDPDLLLQKLKIYGFDDNILAWVESYLTDRHQAVWIDHVLSDFLPCQVGVPQGSNLGPLFFLIFYNDLPYSIKCEVDAYADDSTMTVTGKTVEEIGAKLTENCELVSSWMLGNKLKLNADKTHLMTMGTSARLRLQDSEVLVRMDGVVLEESEDKFETLLGCQIEPHLKWHRQIEELLKKLQKRLTALQNLREIIPFHLRKRITEGIFTSVLAYCLPVFGGCDKFEMEALQIMQNKAARLVTHLDMRTSRKVIFSQVGWMTVNQLIFYHSALSTYRVRQSQEPEYLHKILYKDNRASNIIIPNTSLTLAKNSYCFRGSVQWNSIPDSIRKNLKISQFKSQLKKWILQNVAQFTDS